MRGVRHYAKKIKTQRQTSYSNNTYEQFVSHNNLSVLRKTGNMLNRHFCACAKPFSSPDHHETSISRAFFIFTHISTSIFYQSILSQSEQNFNKYTKLLGLEKKRTLISAFFLISYILIFYTIIIFPYLFFYFFFPFLRNIKIFHISISII